VTERTATPEVDADHHDQSEGSGSARSDISLAVEIIGSVHHVRGTAAYVILVEAAQNLRMTNGECASFIVNAPEGSQRYTGLS
jgi:hypothetical protein